MLHVKNTMQNAMGFEGEKIHQDEVLHQLTNFLKGLVDVSQIIAYSFSLTVSTLHFTVKDQTS